MENYFNYFTEIEEHFQKRRGQPRPLSPLDWSLIESLRDAGVPLAVVLRGVDRAFDKRSKRRKTVGQVNSLAYCTQTILAEHERQKESRVGRNNPASQPAESDPDGQQLLDLLERASRDLEALLGGPKAAEYPALKAVLEKVVSSLHRIILEIKATQPLDYEELELKLNTLEEQIVAAILSGMSEETLLDAKKETQREISRHKRGLKAEHIALLESKLMRKKLLETLGVPRLSLFYLPLN